MEKKEKTPKNNNFSFSNKDLKNLKNCQKNNISNSLKIINTQSFSISTGIDDIKENENKEHLSMKNLKIFDSISLDNGDTIPNKPSLYKYKIEETSNCIDKNEKKISSNDNNLLNIEATVFDNLKSNVNKSNNSLILKNVNVNNICLDKNKKLPLNNLKINNINNIKKNNDINNYDNNQTFAENNIKIIKKVKNNTKYENKLLKNIPPKKSSLYESKYLLSANNYNNKNYSKLNRSYIPNIFYNHLMIQNIKIKNNNSSYFSVCTTNRIKGKLLTLLYCSPVKNI
jgi:hypothetical protein